MNPIYVLCLLLSIFPWWYPVYALEFDEGNLQIHGFVTQALVSSTDNNFYGQSDDGISLDFHEIGINASYRLRPNLLFSGQVLHLENGDVDQHRFLIDYGFADYTAIADEDIQLGIRLGRVKNPFGLYTTTRDVAFTRPSIVLPQSIYFDKARSLALSSDGGALYASYQTAIGAFDLDFVYGNANVDRGSESTFIMRADNLGEMSSKHPTQLVRLMYTSWDDRFRLAFTWTDLTVEYEPVADDPFPIRNYEVHLTPWIVSAQYSDGPWEITGEYSQMRSEISGDIPTPRGLLNYANNNTIEGYYLQGSYWITPAWQVLLRYDVGYNNKDDRSGRTLSANTGLPTHVFFAKDWTVGLRYDVMHNLMLRTEWHHVDGTGWLSVLDNPQPNRMHRKWDLFMLMASWRF
ncbi:MAG: hypothetical protein Kow0065_05270 [Methylomicrobium sp.]